MIFIYNLKKKKYIKYKSIVARYEEIIFDGSKTYCLCAKADEYYFMIYHLSAAYYIILDTCKSNIKYYLRNMYNIMAKCSSISDLEKNIKKELKVMYKIDSISEILFDNIDDIPDINDETRLKLLLEN